MSPPITAHPDQLKAADERAWERDIKKFLRKASKTLAKHQVGETNGLRIPCDAHDGYLRFVMCAGEKGKRYCVQVRCSDSLRHPCQAVQSKSITVNVANRSCCEAWNFGRKAANNFAGPYVETARAVVTSQLTSVHQLGAMIQTAATTVYDKSGAPDKINTMIEQFETVREGSHQAIEHDAYDPLAHTTLIGNKTAPQPPYSVRLKARYLLALAKA